jgi:hypothetical protein
MEALLRATADVRAGFTSLRGSPREVRPTRAPATWARRRQSAPLRTLV